ncbi:hypothetical protein OAP14_02430 [Aliiglaciecola sp.]|nr:hypothetical protein [Aliiglaciecola sp.]
MSDNYKLRNYLKDLELYLARLNQDEANEVVKEIESHIFDAIDQTEAKGSIADVETILQGFGPPRELASGYVSHILNGAPPPRGFRSISLVRKGVSKTLYYSMFVFGYGLGIILIFAGFYNLVIPNSIGIWSVADGNSFVVGTISSPGYIEDGEVFTGLWLTLLFIFCGYLLLLLSHRILQILKLFHSKN